MRTSRRLTHIFGLTMAIAAFSAISFAQTDSTVQVSDQKAGSVLVFPFYGSDGTNANDTRLTITNIGPAGLTGTPPTATEILNNLNVHLFWIDSSCAQADGYVCFTKFQSATFKASEWDPVTARGFLIAVAVDPMGFPISYNGLIGNAFVNCNVTQGGITERWLGNYGAEAFASLGIALNPPPPGTVYFYTTGSTPLAPQTTAALSFNNGPRAGQQGYDAAAGSFAAEFQSPVDSTGQTILTVGLNGTIGTALSGNGIENNNVGAIYRNDEKLYSWTGPSSTCQLLIRISTTNPRVLGGLGSQIGSGKTGTVVWTTVGGSVGLFISPVAGNPAWTGIRGLHKRDVLASRLVIPVFMPTCVQ